MFNHFSDQTRSKTFQLFMRKSANTKNVCSLYPANIYLFKANNRNTRKRKAIKTWSQLIY